MLNCKSNKITSLEGAPNRIQGDSYYDDNPIDSIISIFGYVAKICLEYQETYNFIRKDFKIVKHLLEEAIRDYNEYYNNQVELPEKIEGYTYI